VNILHLTTRGQRPQDTRYRTRKPCCCRETARCRCNFPRWRPAAILDLIEPEIEPFDRRNCWRRRTKSSRPLLVV